MAKPKTRPASGEPGYSPELDQQIQRMRQMLALMAPETGTSALGALREAFADVALSERVRVLADYRR